MVPVTSPRIRIRVLGTDEVTTSVKKMSADFDQATISEARDRAISLREKLRTRTQVAYHRAATGRFSRSLNTSVDVTRAPGGSTLAIIKVTGITYRESKFLTSFFPGGFTDFPVDAYYIFAKGLRDIFDPSLLRDKSLREQNYGNKRHLAKIGRRLATSRLKVPRSGYDAVVGRGGREHTVAQDVGGLPPAMPGDLSTTYYYPLWVEHPEIEEDVVAEVVTEEGEEWKNNNLTNAKVIFNPSNPQAGIGLQSVGVRRVSGTTETVAVRTTGAGVAGIGAGSAGAAGADPLQTVRKFMRGG
jgi:hypothetical protein